MRLIVIVVLLAFLPTLTAQSLSNVPSAHLGTGAVVLLALATIAVAPIVEELMFRGLLLRAAMQRLPFWAAAAVSSVLFGLFHAPQARTGLAAFGLLTVMASFGYVQCLLVRRTGRLTPAIGVHALGNAIAIVLLLST